MLIIEFYAPQIMDKMNNSEMSDIGAFQIHIGEIVTPSIFWGFKVESDAKAADRRQLAEIELQMTKMFQKANTPMMSKPYIGCVSNFIYFF